MSENDQKNAKKHKKTQKKRKKKKHSFLFLFPFLSPSPPPPLLPFSSHNRISSIPQRSHKHQFSSTLHQFQSIFSNTKNTKKHKKNAKKKQKKTNKKNIFNISYLSPPIIEYLAFPKGVINTNFPVLCVNFIAYLFEVCRIERHPIPPSIHWPSRRRRS